MSTSLPPSIFANTGASLFKYRYNVKIIVGTLVGGVPTNEAVAEGWIKTKLGLSTKELVAAEVEKVMDARGVTADDAVEKVARDRHLTGFERDFLSPTARADQQRAMTSGFIFEGTRKIFTKAEAEITFGELLVKGRHVKAMLKEALMIGVGAGHIEATKWGKTSKAAKGFFAEHCFVEEEDIRLGVTEPTLIKQAFVHTWRGAGIKLEEQVTDAELGWTIIADWDFEAKVPDFWGIIMSIAERNGLGASRSQGYGRFSTVQFERVESTPAQTKAATKRARELKELEAVYEAERAAGAVKAVQGA